jgi:hypothetical protein
VQCGDGTAAYRPPDETCQLRYSDSGPDMRSTERHIRHRVRVNVWRPRSCGGYSYCPGRIDLSVKALPLRRTAAGPPRRLRPVWRRTALVGPPHAAMAARQRTQPQLGGERGLCSHLLQHFSLHDVVRCRARGGAFDWPHGGSRSHGSARCCSRRAAASGCARPGGGSPHGPVWQYRSKTLPPRAPAGKGTRGVRVQQWPGWAARGCCH